MDTVISKRELNHQTAAVLSQVTATDDVVITERGQRRWRLSAIREDETPLGRLEREGRYTPPVVEPAPWPERPGGRPYTDAEVDALRDEMRGEH